MDEKHSMEEKLSMEENNSREILFARTLEQIRRTAIEQSSCIREQQVREAFDSFELSEEQLQMVYDYLRKHNIGIDRPHDMEEDSSMEENLSMEEKHTTEEFLTEEERDFLQQYLEEIAVLGSINETEEKHSEEKEAVTLSAIAGDVAARNRLVELYLQDVAQIARLYAGQGVYLEDLIGEGNVALTKGVSLLGCIAQDEKLTSKAEHVMEAWGMLGKMIMDAMEEYIRQNAANKKADQAAVHKVNLVMEKARELAEDLRRKVTPEELAAETELTIEAIWEAIRLSGFNIEYIEVDRDAKTGL